MRKPASFLLAVAFPLTLVVVLLLTTFAWPGAQSAALAVGRSLETRRVASAITIDGDLSDWPAGPALILDTGTAQYTAGAISGPLDLSASLRSVWDGSYLYVSAIITDDALLADSSNIWDDDSIEIALDGANDARCCGSDDHQYAVAVDGRLADFGTLVPSGSSLVTASVRQVTGGYRIEMAIPLYNLTGVPVVSGTVMGFNIGLNDDDDGGRRDKRLVWAGNSTLDFTNLGALLFVGDAPPTPTRTATSATPPAATATRTPTATPPPAATATPAATSTATATRTPTLAVTATPTVPAGPTASPNQRLTALESGLATLEARVQAILDILQRAGRFPETRGAVAPTATVPAGRTTPSGTQPMARGVEAGAYYQAVNCGGSAYTAINGDFYAADQAYTPGGWGHLGGQVAQVANAIAGSDDDTLYQSERYNFTGYSFDVPTGTYNITLRFAEIYQFTKAGGRVFDVKIENSVVITDLDLVVRAGLFTALDFTFPVTVTDGQLNVTFVPKAGAAKINAIQVRSSAPAVPSPTPTSLAPTPTATPTGPTPPPSSEDRLRSISAKLTDLETIVAGILQVFRSTQDTPTPTVTSTATRTLTPTPGPPTATRTVTRTPVPTNTPTVTVTPGGPTPTPHVTGKKGVAGDWDNPIAISQVGLAWGYNWYISPENFNSMYEHVPMIWGASYDAQYVADSARAHPGSYWLIFNEPDYWQQANLTPAQAAQVYRTLRSIIKGADPTAKLIVGGVLNLNTQWLTNFRTEYYRLYGEWPVVEGWHVHHYVGGTEYDITRWRESMNTVLPWMQKNGGVTELWLTEFGCLTSDAVAYRIMADQVAWLDAQPWITRYAWYAAFASGSGCPGCAGSLFNWQDGSLTDLGRLYRSLP